MKRRSMQIILVLRRWWFDHCIRRASLKIVHDVYPELWDKVRRKTGAFKNQADLKEYAQVRAAQLSHKRVDSLVQANPKLSGEFATSILLRSSELATRMVLSAATQVMRAAA